LLFVLGGVIFKISAPRECPPLSRTENIVVLTGDIRRIPFGMQLLKNQPLRRMYIIGVGGHNYSAMIPRAQRGKIHLETESRTTYENSLAIREIVQAQGIQSFALVTTSDHMHRSLLLIRRRLPNTNIVPCPVPLHGMPANRKLERWGMEYLKYLGTVLGIESKK